MAIGNVWRPTMYGGLAGAILGSSAILAGWTSPSLCVCFLQFIAILGCGTTGGLIVAYGPVPSLMWVLGASEPGATWKDVGQQLKTRALVGELAIALMVAWREPSLRLLILMFAWLIALPLLVTIEPRTETSKKPWEVALGHAVIAVYAPFLLAAFHTWWFDGGNTWLKTEYWQYFLVVPGGVVVEIASASIWHRHPDLSPVGMFVVAGFVSTILVATVAWLAAKTGRWRWIALPLVSSLSAFGALITDALMRA